MARHLLIATHAGLAKGFKEALDILVGNTSNVTVINCFTEVVVPQPVIADYFANIPSEDELLVLTDLMGGSVNQIFMGYLPKRNFHLISGINLPLVLQIALCFEETVTVDFINETIEQARTEIKYVNYEIEAFSAANRDKEEDSLF